jgi:hypothetical protein
VTYDKNGRCSSIIAKMPEDLHYLDDNDRSKGLRIIYNGGSTCYDTLGINSKRLYLNLICDQNSDFEVSNINRDSDCLYSIEFRTK